jgi:hypothetical protein
MELTLTEVRNILKYIIKNNEDLQQNGKMPIAACVESEAGIGKSSVIEDLAKELDYNYVKLSLSQISELGDCVGFPIRLHYACKDSECHWISPELIDSYVKSGYTITDETKMSYALPEWYKRIDPSKGTIINLDDWTRCLPHIAQGLMELIYKQELWSFKLPPKTTVLLSSNPDSADYNISSSLDEAQRTRMINFKVKFDINSWASWAENNNIDGRAINFLLEYYPELMENKNHTHIMNARSYTTFANTISGIQDWSKPESLALILQIASGCFNDEDNLVGSLFTTFIANKLDKLISPEDMLLKPWGTIKNQIKSCVYNENGSYRPEIASILHTRLLNYSLYYFGKTGSKTDVVQDRLLQLIDAPDEVDSNGSNIGCMLFSEDFLFNIIKTLISKYPAKTNKFMLNKKIRSKII